MSISLFSIEQSTENGIPGIKVMIDRRLIGFDESDCHKHINRRRHNWPKTVSVLVFVMLLLQVLFLGLTLVHCIESVRMSEQFSKFLTMSYSYDAWPLVVLCMSSLLTIAFILWILHRHANLMAKRERDELEFRVESWKTIMENALLKHGQLLYPKCPNGKCRITIIGENNETSTN